MRRHPILRVLCATCVAVALAACQRDDGNQLAGPAHRMPGDALAWRVERAEATRHIAATSTQESRDATEGNQFVVLDVRVDNPDAQPQVVSEGSLLAIDASHEQRFATPVSMLAGEFLTLQVLPPAASTRGKIAFEVPEALSGALYWTPGNSTRRILLHVQAASVPRTQASAPADAGASPSTAIVPAPPPVPSSTAPSAPTPARKPRSADQLTLSKRRAAGPSGKRIVANAAPSSSARLARSKPTAARGTVIPAAQEQERRARCEDLLTRNAQADEALRPFYLLNCPDYPLPPAWRTAGEDTAPAVAAATPRPSTSECGAGDSRAARLVCGDPYLAGLDRRLARSLSGALGVVDDPAALRREQEDWRVRVRDACGTIRCLELAYGRRTAHVDALGKAMP